VDGFGRVEPEASLCLVVHHPKHVGSVLAIALRYEEKTSRQSAGGCFSDRHLQETTRSACSVDVGKCPVSQLHTLGSRSAVQRLSSRSGTLS
jgi:hypothetical protein